MKPSQQKNAYLSTPTIKFRRSLWRVLLVGVLVFTISTVEFKNNDHSHLLWAQSGVIEGPNCPQTSDEPPLGSLGIVSMYLDASSNIEWVYLQAPEIFQKTETEYPDCLLIDRKNNIEEPIKWPIDRPGVYCYSIKGLLSINAGQLAIDEQRALGRPIHFELGDQYDFGEIRDIPLNNIYGFQERSHTNEVIIVDRLPDDAIAQKVEVWDESGEIYRTFTITDPDTVGSTEIDLPRGSQVDLKVIVTITKSDKSTYTLTSFDTLRPFDVSQMYTIYEYEGKAHLQETNCTDFFDVEKTRHKSGAPIIEPSSNPIPGVIASSSGQYMILDGKKGEVLRFTMYGDNIASELTLKDSSDHSIAHEWYFESYRKARATVLLQEDDYYSIIATSLPNDQLDVGRYNLIIEKLSQVSRDEAEHTSLLNYGATKSGEITNSTGHRFIFYGEEGRKVTIGLDDRGGLKPVLKLYSPDGKLISIDKNGCCLGGTTKYSSIQISRLPVTGIYTIIAQGDDGSTGQYRLEFNSVPTIAYFHPHSIEYGDTHPGKIATGASQQWMFDGRAGDDIQIFMASTSSLDTALMLISPEGEILTSNDDQRNCTSSYCGRSQMDSYIEYNNLPISGSYTIIADGWDDGMDDLETGAYEISLRRR